LKPATDANGSLLLGSCAIQETPVNRRDREKYKCQADFSFQEKKENNYVKIGQKWGRLPKEDSFVIEDATDIAMRKGSTREGLMSKKNGKEDLSGANQSKKNRGRRSYRCVYFPNIEKTLNASYNKIARKRRRTSGPSHAHATKRKVCMGGIKRGKKI